MNKEQAQAYIAVLNDKVKAADKFRNDLRSRVYGRTSEQIKKATQVIQSKMDAVYKPQLERASAAQLKALNRWKAARIRYAADLIGIPVTTVMGEWDNSWGGWKPTGACRELGSLP